MAARAWAVRKSAVVVLGSWLCDLVSCYGMYLPRSRELVRRMCSRFGLRVSSGGAAPAVFSLSNTQSSRRVEGLVACHYY